MTPTKILLVFPLFNPNSFWSFGSACEAAEARCPAPPLGLITLAALLPKRGSSGSSTGTLSLSTMTGEPLFTTQAIVILPTGLITEELRTELERIANDVMVDLALTESDNAKAD